MCTTEYTSIDVVTLCQVVHIVYLYIHKISKRETKKSYTKKNIQIQMHSGMERACMSWFNVLNICGRYTLNTKKN